MPVSNLERARAVGHDPRSREAAATRIAEALRPAFGAAAAGGLFAACDALSTAAYEGGEARGRLLLVPRDHPAIDVLLEPVEPTPLAATRAARKLLELSRADVAPLCDGAALWGLGRVARPSDPARADLFEVRFDGAGRWALWHAGEPVLAVEAAPPPRPSPALPRARFEALAREVLGAREPDVGRLRDAVEAVIATARGSTVLVSADAAAEAVRLAGQGTRIAPRPLGADALQAATGIGGAVLLDVSGTCHAIGVILDGIAGPHGARSRGSRYNSAANYVRGRPRTVAVVVSDDGSVDLLAG